MIYLADNLKPTIQELDALQGRWQKHESYHGVIAHWLFNEGGGNRVHDLSGNGNHATIISATWAQCKLGPCLSCNGTSDYATVLDSAVPQPVFQNLGNDNAYTVVARINTSSTTDSTAPAFTRGGRTIIDARQENTVTYCPFSLGKTGSFGHFGLADNDSAAARASNSSISGGIDRHLALVLDTLASPITYLLYHNGVSDGSGTGTIATLNQTHLGTTLSNISIGVASRDGGQFDQSFWDGQIQEIKIINKAWTQAQVVDDYNDPLAPFRWAAEQRPVVYSIPATAGAPAATQYYRRLVGA